MMYLLASIQKAVATLALNETNAIRKDDQNLAVLSFEKGNAIFRHITYSNNQKLKLTVSPVLGFEPYTETISDSKGCHYTVSVMMTRRVLFGIARLVGKSALIGFCLPKASDELPIIKIKAGDYEFLLPVSILSKVDNAEIVAYDDLFMDAAIFKTAITFDKAAIETVAKHDVRYYLTGVAVDFIDAGDRNLAINLVSTDGHRAAVFKKELNTAINSKNIDYIKSVKGKPPIIPINAYQVITAFCPKNDPVTMSITQVGKAYQAIVFNAVNDDVAMDYSTKTIDGLYPDYSRLMGLTEPLSIDLDLSKFLLMLTYQSIYMVGFENECLPSTTFDVCVKDGQASIVLMPKQSLFLDAPKSTKSGLQRKVLARNRSPLDTVNSNLFEKLSMASPKFYFDCTKNISGRFKFLLNIKYLRDALALFKGSKKVRMEFSTFGATEDVYLSTPIHFKNHEDDCFTGEQGKIATLVMTLRM